MRALFPLAMNDCILGSKGGTYSITVLYLSGARRLVATLTDDFIAFVRMRNKVGNDKSRVVRETACPRLSEEKKHTGGNCLAFNNNYIGSKAAAKLYKMSQSSLSQTALVIHRHASRRHYHPFIFDRCDGRTLDLCSSFLSRTAILMLLPFSAF